MSIKQLRKFAPGFAWAGFFEEAGLAKTDRVIVAEKSAFPKLAAIWAQTPAGTLQHGTLCTSSIMPRRTFSKAFADAYFDMHDRTLAGQKEQKVRWKRGVLTVSGGDFAVGDRFGTFGTLGFDGWRVFNSKKKLAPHLARHLEVLCKGRFSLPIFL